MGENMRSEMLSSGSWFCGTSTSLLVSPVVEVVEDGAAPPKRVAMLQLWRRDEDLVFFGGFSSAEARWRSWRLGRSLVLVLELCANCGGSPGSEKYARVFSSRVGW